MRKAIALLRVSSEAQAAEDRAGLPAQRREIERVAAAHELELVEWVELAGVSGARVLDDARFARFLERLEDPEVEGVVVAAVDRLMRPESLSDYAILEAFRRTKTALYTPSGRRDLETDRLVSVLETELAHLERTRIRERTTRAKEVHRLAGRHVSGESSLPFGVTYEKADARWGYDAPKARVVRAIFERFLAGDRHFTRIGAELGVSRTMVRKILRQPLYMGVRRITHRYEPGRRWVPRAPHDVIEQRVIDAPIVDAATFALVQEQLDGRRRPARGPHEELLAGLAVCGACARPMHVHAGRGPWWAYRCPGGSGQGACRPGRVNGQAADLEAARVLGAALADVELLEAAIADAMPHAGEELEAGAELEGKRLREERERVLVAFERGIRALPETERRVREIDAALRRLERDVRRASSRPDGAAELAAELAAPFGEWDSLTPGQRRRILVAGVEAVTLEPAGRGRVAIPAFRLRAPFGGSPLAANGPRRSTWAVWGNGPIEVRL